MSDLDERTVIEAGGWDGRYAVVRAVGTLGDHGAAVIDANGDGADINLEHFRRVDGEWVATSSTGGPGDWGRGWSDGVWAEHDRGDDGWWLTLEEGPEPDDDVSERPAGQGSFGWVAWTPEAPTP
ncbi:hypothetical protein [Nocardioides lijunqiniae]|uniref:hypothetical protein n=1 Tax=Nocardioides lijunqiniae TaxID=2760832 RepID=UPI001878CD17|nr:hypothetical protein [Nocardioides lijunqiniae]